MRPGCGRGRRDQRPRKAPPPRPRAVSPLGWTRRGRLQGSGRSAGTPRATLAPPPRRPGPTRVSLGRGTARGSKTGVGAGAAPLPVSSPPAPGPSFSARLPARVPDWRPRPSSPAAGWAAASSGGGGAGPTAIGERRGGGGGAESRPRDARSRPAVAAVVRRASAQRRAAPAMREIVHIQAGQCGNQIGTKVGLALHGASPRVGGCRAPGLPARPPTGAHQLCAPGSSEPGADPRAPQGGSAQGVAGRGTSAPRSPPPPQLGAAAGGSGASGIRPPGRPGWARMAASGALGSERVSPSPRPAQVLGSDQR